MSELACLYSSYLEKKEGRADPKKVEEMSNDREELLSILYTLKVGYERLVMPYSQFVIEYQNISTDEIKEETNRKLGEYRRGRSEEEWIKELILVRDARILHLRSLLPKRCRGMLSIVSPIEFPKNKTALEVIEEQFYFYREVLNNLSY
ncbi:MAG: hypothetical protein QXY70_03740 [Nanopusillaceae archaeon]